MLAEWIQKWVQEGREQWLAGEQSLLCRQAACTVDAETADRLASAIADLHDTEQLSGTGERIIAAETGSEVIEEVRVYLSKNSVRAKAGTAKSPSGTP